MRVGEWLRGDAVVEEIRSLDPLIEQAAAIHGVDPNLMRGIIFEEQTHTWPLESYAEKAAGYPGDIPRNLVALAVEQLGKGNTVGLGQMTVGRFGTKEQLLNPGYHLMAMANHLAQLGSHPTMSHSDGSPHPAASIATLWNNGNAAAISEYGRRVAHYTAVLFGGCVD